VFLLGDVDLTRGVVTVRGKGSRTSSVRMRQAYVETRELLDALRAYLAIRPVGPVAALFLSHQNAPLEGYALVHIVQKRARQAGIPRSVRPYDLRVSFASRLVVRGADPFALRVLMGHDTIETTFGLYTSLSLEEVRNVWRETNPLTPPVSDRETD
jgi:integrase/recombinase XerD